MSKIYTNNALLREAQIELDDCKDDIAIFDTLYLRLQTLDVSGFAYIQMPQIGAIDFDTPVRAYRGLSEGEEQTAKELDAKSFRELAVLTADNMDFSRSYPALPITLNRQGTDKLGLNVSSAPEAEHFLISTTGPNYNMGCFLVSTNGFKNAEKLYDVYTMCHMANRILYRWRTRADKRKVSSRVLTPREQSVMELIVHGYSTQAAAEALSISPHTVSKYIQHIILKLNVENRTSASFRVIAENLISY